MKEGWKYVKLGDIASVVHGKNQKAVESEEGQYPIYGSGGSIMGYATEYLCDEGTTILGRKGTINNPLFIETKFWNVDTAFGISAKSTCNKKFLYYFVKSQDWSKKNSGTTLPSLTQSVVLDTQMPFCDISEQKQIVDFLDAEFAKIDELKNQAEQSLQNAQDLFQAALKEMLTPKEGWKEERLNNIYNFIDYRGATPTKLSSGVPLVTAKNVRYGYLDYTIKDYISQEEYLSRQSRGVSHRGDILFTTEAPLGMVALADLDVFSAGQRLITFQQYQPSKHLLYNKFFLYYFMGPEFQKTIHKLATGATAQGIKASILKEIKVFVPNIQEQLSISEKLDGISLRIQQLQSNYTRTIQLCADLKQALLRQVFE